MAQRKVRLIIAGNRTLRIGDVHIPWVLALTQFVPYEIVCGEAKGGDFLGKMYAQAVGLPVKSFPADWDRYGNSAGPRRNREMGLYADALLALWNGESAGTGNMISVMKELNKPYYVHRYDLEPEPPPF